MPEPFIQNLIDRLLAGTITPEEKVLLAQWVLRDHGDQELLSAMEISWREFQPGESIPVEKADQILDRIFERIKDAEMPVHLPWWKDTLRVARLAAAVLLFAVLGAAGWYLLREKRPAAAPAIVASTDVNAPAASNAVLTLSDGRRIVLDSAGRGNIALQEQTAIRKAGDGEISYQAAGSGTALTGAGGTADGQRGAVLLYNTLTVPEGSRIAQVTLSDGTRVWLNAGSSLHYPVAFQGADRSVEVTGETYFEVAKDPKHPFVVHKGDCAVQVLGTHFNVNAYEGEKAMRVTLLEGAIAVHSGSGNRLLSPGQMAAVGSGHTIEVLNHVDTDRVMAWKNGYFNFASSDIASVMRELARWYGLKLIFQDEIPDTFHVEISRSISLSKVLEILEMTGKVHFRITGNTVTVLR